MINLCYLLLIQTGSSTIVLNCDARFMGVDTQAVIKISRTVLSDDGVQILEIEKWTDGTLWDHRQTFEKDGAFRNWGAEWKNAKEPSAWTAKVKDGKVITKTLKYRGRNAGQTLAYKRPLLELGDPSIHWFATISPKVGEETKASVFIPSVRAGADVYDVKVKYLGDETLTLNRKEIKVHKIQRLSRSRNETWYMNDEALPVKRLYWSKKESEPYRTDVVK